MGTKSFGVIFGPLLLTSSGTMVQRSGRKWQRLASGTSGTDKGSMVTHSPVSGWQVSACPLQSHSLQ